jgi:hypothetical protein
MDVVRQRRKGWLPGQVSPAGLQVWRVRREMGTAAQLTSSQPEQPAVSMASPSDRDSDLGLGLGFGACFGSGLGKALRERFALGVSARSQWRREVRPRSVSELSSGLPSDSGTR